METESAAETTSADAANGASLDEPTLEVPVLPAPPSQPPNVPPESSEPAAPVVASESQAPAPPDPEPEAPPEVPIAAAPAEDSQPSAAGRPPDEAVPASTPEPGLTETGSLPPISLSEELAPAAAANDGASAADSVPVELEPDSLSSDTSELAAADLEPATTELRRPPALEPPQLTAAMATIEAAALAPAFSPLSEPRESPARERSSATGRDESEVQTKPKIRLPSEPGARRASGPPPARTSDAAPSRTSDTAPARTSDAAPARTSDAAPAAGKNGRGKSSAPPPPAAKAKVSPLPPAPAGHASRPVTLSGEGIVRNTPLPPADPAARQRDSDVPTRPRIPLTQDMAMAAGRITSQDVPPYGDESATRPRLSLQSLTDAVPSVIVTRAHVISDPPPANGLTADVFVGRPSRRPARPDSEEFETLDLDDGDEMARDEMARAEAKESSGGVSAVSGDVNVRVPRTPPPPPAQPPKRSNTGQFPANQRAAPPPPPPTAPPKRAPAPTKAQRAQTTKKRAWWEVLFSDDYIRTLPRPSTAAIGKQVGFMESSLGIKRGDAVLDVGCGLGHHALEFAKRGYLVVALDLALSMITRAAEEAQQRGLRINFLHKDIRDIGFEGTFDAIICVGTTFGFFDDEQNRNVLQRLAHALKPGGRLLLDVVNRDYVVGSQPNLVWFEGENCVVMEESDFNYYSSRLNVKRTMMRDDGRQSDIEYNLRLYSVHELGQMLKQCGFSIKEVSGQEATRGLFFGAQSMRIIILAERRAPGRKSESERPANE